jgi:hypothetical protein
MKTAGLLNFLSKFKKVPAKPALTGANATAANLLKSPEKLFKVKTPTTPQSASSAARADFRTRLSSAKYASMADEFHKVALRRHTVLRTGIRSALKRISKLPSAFQPTHKEKIRDIRALATGLKSYKPGREGAIISRRKVVQSKPALRAVGVFQGQHSRPYNPEGYLPGEMDNV